MRVYSREDLINKNELNTVNILRGVVHKSGVEYCKYKTYFGILDNAQTGDNFYSAMGHIFGREPVTRSDKDAVISFLKHYFPGCSVVINDMDTTNSDAYVGIIQVNWD